MFSITSLIFACLIYYGAHGLSRPQIVGGIDAPDGLYPYQVSLKDSYTKTHRCGGAIVSKRYIITAAHCLESPYYPHNVDVDVGSNLLYSQTTYEAEELIIHPNYNRTLAINDIGLIKLKKDIKFNSNTKPIALVSSDKNFDGVGGLIVTGWGNTSPDGPTPEHLQQIVVTGYSQETCAHTYDDISERQVCTLLALGKGICSGDSGGALIYNGELVGIASFGREGPCAAGFPDVFTRVFHYRDWVNKYINAGCNQQLNILLGLFTMYLCIHSFS
ncbi:chymotrypsin-2-like isoform X2 [Temnothorax curvispinosus]|uniref:chymotrypsin n=1 Tax=Temnothorax curvispinosus TaxID=300111 RepID=A0A6J1Q592_9HYME|nr:chymotrypsin-2-like isoform X2 [Temnothorax curvispinosus]